MSADPLADFDEIFAPSQPHGGSDDPLDEFANTPAPPETAPAQLESFGDATLTEDLIPLHRWNFRDADGKERGKSPRDGAWGRRPYKPWEIESWIQSGNNVGFRIPSGWVVLDYDPRNVSEGRDVLAEFQVKFSVDLSKYPRVRTGSGGSHWYMRNPSLERFVNELAEFRGIEIKGVGRQVVAPGSVHPCGGPYQWMKGPALKDAPEVPSALRLAARWMSHQAESAPHKEISVAEVNECLRQIDVTTYNGDHERWLELMISVHAASGGDTEMREAFIEWCVGDPNYASHDEQIRSRWDSLHAGRPGGITVGTLYYHVQASGGRIPHAPADEVFADAPLPQPAPPPRSRIELLSYTDMKNRPIPPYLVDDLLVSDGMTSVIGAPKRGKTYWTLPMALCVATGRPFFGRSVRPGRVVYVCTEGGIGRFRQRIDAHLKHHEIDPGELDGRFVLVPTPIRLLNRDDADALLQALGDGYDLAIYDTLARTMGGNENDTADMNAYVDALDRLRGAGANGTQVVVHHTGKDTSRGGRGSNALPGAVEREFVITRPRRGVHVARISNDRHSDGSWKEVYRFQPVDIGEEGPTPGVLVRDDAATTEFLDPKYDALIAACNEAPGRAISTDKAIDLVWQAGKAAKPDYQRESARRWVDRLPKVPQWQAASGLQRTDDGVRLASGDEDQSWT